MADISDNTQSTAPQTPPDLPNPNDVEAALYQSEERFRQIVEHTNEWVWEVNTDGLYIYSSPIVEKILGYTPNEIVFKKHFHDLMIPEDRDRLLDAAFKVFEQKGSFNNIINRNRHKDGSIRWLATSGVPMLDDQGNLVGYRGVDSDITERIENEKKLEKAKEQAEKANMSHEIRTPMNDILGFIQALADEDLTTKQKDFVDIVQSNCRHLMAVINDIFDYSKIEVGQLEIEAASCSVESLLQSIDSEFQPLADDKSIVFDIREKSTLPDTIITDSARLEQCLANLLHHAFGRTVQGYVYLNISHEDLGGIGYLRFDVEDSGPVIPDSMLPIFYDQFSKAELDSRKIADSGLQLALVKELTLLMGGYISAKSAPHGAIFTLSVPTHPDSTDSTPTNITHIRSSIRRTPPGVDHKPQPRRSASKDLNVLVVEDNPTNQKLIALLLKNFGLNVTLAEDGQKAVDAVKNQMFDIILMDMQMPVMNGYDATAALRNDNISIPIIAVTAHAMKGDRQKCLNAGCDEYVTKPISKDTLLETIARFLPLD